jgi:hypothetical protein
VKLLKACTLFIILSPFASLKASREGVEKIIARGYDIINVAEMLNKELAEMGLATMSPQERRVLLSEFLHQSSALAHKSNAARENPLASVLFLGAFLGSGWIGSKVLTEVLNNWTLFGTSIVLGSFTTCGYFGYRLTQWMAKEDMYEGAKYRENYFANLLQADEKKTLEARPLSLARSWI